MFKHKYKSGTALEILQEAILFGDISGQITQDEIAKALKVSRIPVREALIALEFQGLIERLPGQHIKVINLNDEYIYSVFNDMALLEIETLKTFPEEKLKLILSCEEQINFHRLILENIKFPLRKNFLKIIIEIYLTFVLENSNNLNKIEASFMNLKDIKRIKTNYKIYSEVLANELIEIRIERKNKNHVESQTR